MQAAGQYVRSTLCFTNGCVAHRLGWQLSCGNCRKFTTQVGGHNAVDLSLPTPSKLDTQQPPRSPLPSHTHTHTTPPQQAVRANFVLRRREHQKQSVLTGRILQPKVCSPLPVRLPIALLRPHLAPLLRPLRQVPYEPQLNPEGARLPLGGTQQHLCKGGIQKEGHEKKGSRCDMDCQAL